MYVHDLCIVVKSLGMSSARTVFFSLFFFLFFFLKKMLLSCYFMVGNLHWLMISNFSDIWTPVPHYTDIPPAHWVRVLERVCSWKVFIIRILRCCCYASETFFNLVEKMTSFFFSCLRRIVCAHLRINILSIQLLPRSLMACVPIQVRAGTLKY